MTTFKVKVKWGKEVYPDIELDTGEEPEVFKAQVFALTGVQPARQKLLLKGGTIKADTWQGAKLKEGCLIIMMGSRDEDMLQEPASRPVFLEDMTEEQSNVAMDMPAGITNLGNTCYLNATIQCFKTVPELKKAILEFAPEQNSLNENSVKTLFIQRLGACLETIDRGETATPTLMVSLFRKIYPRFAEQSNEGGYVQQDANECWTELMELLRGSVLTPGEGRRTSPFARYLTGQMSSVMTCTEAGGEAPVTSSKDFHQLSCHINSDVKYLHTGLTQHLNETITKNSELLARDAVFSRESRITRLPAYLTINMIRFSYKRKEAVNAKILKDVKFPLNLDVFDVCSPKLQKRLEPYRVHFKDMDDRQKEEARALKSGRTVKDEDKIKVKDIPSHFAEDVGSCNSGYYSLQAVLTHQGRTSSSGHYVAWVRLKGDAWVKCDDDTMSAVAEEDVLRLSGGGDWHCGYVLLYGPRPLSVPEDVVITDVSEAEAEEACKKGETAGKEAAAGASKDAAGSSKDAAAEGSKGADSAPMDTS